MVCLVWRQAETHTQRERVWVSSLVRRNAVKRLYSSVLGLCFHSGQLCDFFFLTWPTLRLSPGRTGTPQPRWILKWWLLRGARLIMAWCYPLPFGPQRTFLHICCVSLVPKEWGGRSLNPLLKQGFAPLCPCHDYYLQVLTREKHWLIYPVYAVTCVSEGKQKSDWKCLNWSPPISCLRKC